MDTVLQEVGVCGPFQVCHVTAVQACRLMSAWAMSLMIFGLYNPGWTCTGPANGTATTVNTSYSYNPRSPMGKLNLSSGYGESLGNHIISEGDRTGPEKGPNNYSSTCSLYKSCERIDFNPDSNTIVTEFNLICDRVWIAYLILSVLSAGILIGSFVWGQVGELFGRRFGLYASNVTMVLACGLAIFSPGWEVYTVFMFFIGFGVTGVTTNFAVLCMEFLSWQWRARVTALPIWNVGVLTFALLTYIVRDWKLVHLVTAVGCGFTCLGVFWTPESIRWLMVHKKISGAEKVLGKIVKLNGKAMTIDRLGELVKEREGRMSRRHYTYLDLFKTKVIRNPLLKLVIIWVIVTAVYEVIGFGIQSLPGDFYTNFFIASAAEFPGVLFIGPLANRCGRRWTGIVFMCIGTLCCAGIIGTLFTTETGGVREILMNGLALTDKAAMVAMISLMITYTTELMPTAVRNLSFGFCQVAVRVVGMLTPFMLPRDFFSMVLCFSMLTNPGHRFVFLVRGNQKQPVERLHSD